MARAKFDPEDFVAAALAIAAAHGPSAVTVASVSAHLGSPTGSFYHRFASRNLLLGALWLRIVVDFQQGIVAALDAGDGLRAALHTPAWVRAHPNEARLLLLHHRDDFIHGDWPKELRAQVAIMTQSMETQSARFAHLLFGGTSEEEQRLAQFLLAEVPVAAVRHHVLRGEPPPALVDGLIRVTYQAVIAEYRR